MDHRPAASPPRSPNRRKRDNVAKKRSSGNEPITINSDPLTLDGDPLTGDVITGDPKVRISVVFSYGGYGISVSYQGGAEIQAPADIKNLTRRQIGGPNPWGGWIEYINEPPIASGAAQLEPN